MKISSPPFLLITIASVVLDLLVILSWFLWLFIVPYGAVSMGLRMLFSFAWGNALVLAINNIIKNYTTFQEQHIRKQFDVADYKVEAFRRNNGKGTKVRTEKSERVRRTKD